MPDKVPFNIKVISLRLPGKARALSAGLSAVLAAILMLASPAVAVTLRVTWDPVSVKPGSAVALKVEAPLKLSRAEATAGGERLPLIKTAQDGYVALVAIDLNYKYAVYPVQIELFPNQGQAPYRIQADLKVQGRDFSTQSLILPQGMVDLSGEHITRVNTENSDIRGVLDRRTRHRYWQRPFIMPLSGRTTGSFGVRRVLNGEKRSPHRGMDIASPLGTTIAASNSGVVSLARDFLLSGKTMVIDHGWGVSTIYAHMSAFEVKAGQKVAKGQVIGRVGATGRASGPHLHFGAQIRGASIDPASLVHLGW